MSFSEKGSDRMREILDVVAAIATVIMFVDWLISKVTH